MSISQRLTELSITLPTVAAPVASYVPAVQVGNQIQTSGQLPFRDGELVQTGKLGGSVEVAEGQELARLSILNALAAVAEAAGGIDNVKRVVKLTVFVASHPDFVAQPQVANGASDLLVEIFGEAGTHIRSAVGVAVLPLDAPVELELTVEV